MITVILPIPSFISSSFQNIFPIFSKVIFTTWVLTCDICLAARSCHLISEYRSVVLDISILRFIIGQYRIVPSRRRPTASSRGLMARPKLKTSSKHAVVYELYGRVSESLDKVHRWQL